MSALAPFQNSPPLIWHVSARVFEGRFFILYKMITVADVLPEAGWVGRDAILMTGINAIVYLLSTIPPYGHRFLPCVLIIPLFAIDGYLSTDGGVVQFYYQGLP